VFLLPLWAGAARSYQFSGKVTGIHGDTVALSHGLETLEFDRSSSPKASRDLSRVRIGDELTIWYRLDALKAGPYSEPRQQPGQAAPEPQPSAGAPSEKKHIILDDRAFYDARNERGGSGTPRPGA
jgi:hypothetical protein